MSVSHNGSYEISSLIVKFSHLLSFMFRLLSFPTRSTRSRNDFDDGLYSEHIMLRNLFVCWLLVVEEQRGKYGNQSKITPDGIFESCRWGIDLLCIYLNHLNCWNIAPRASRYILL